MHYIYFMKCCDNSLYCGYTTDPKRREAEHNSGKGAKYTRSRLPVTLVYTEEFDTKEEALKRECAIKKLSREKKLLLIEEYRKRGIENENH